MLLLPILQKLNAYFKGQLKIYSSAPFHPFLELPFLILCSSCILPNLAVKHNYWGRVSEIKFFSELHMKFTISGVGLHFEVLQVILMCPSTHQLGTIN